MLFAAAAKQEFKAKDKTSGAMSGVISLCGNVYAGKPDWVDAAEHIKTINFAKSVCSEMARLATLDIGVTV